MNMLLKPPRQIDSPGFMLRSWSVRRRSSTGCSAPGKRRAPPGVDPRGWWTDACRGCPSRIGWLSTMPTSLKELSGCTGYSVPRR